MKKTIFFLLLFMLFIGCNNKNKSNEILEFEQVEFDDKTPIDCKADDCTTISLSIPFITNKDNAIADKINSKVLSTIDNIVELDDKTAMSASYEELTKNFIDNYNEFLTKYPDETLPWKAEIDGDITFFNEDVLSIALEYYTFAGGAYGFESEMALNFNPKTGELYSMQDIIGNWEELQKLFALQLKNKMDIWSSNHQLNYPESIFFYENTIAFLYNALDEDMTYNGPIKIELPKENVIPFLKINLSTAVIAN